MSMEDLDPEKLEMQDMSKRIQEEGEEEETNIEWDSFYDNFDNDTPLHDSRLPILPDLPGVDDLPGTSHKHPESGKNITLEMFIRRNFNDNFKLYPYPYNGNILELIKRTNVSQSGGIQFKPIGKSSGYLKPQTVLKREGNQLKFREAVEQFKTLLESAV